MTAVLAILLMLAVLLLRGPRGTGRRFRLAVDKGGAESVHPTGTGRAGPGASAGGATKGGVFRAGAFLAAGRRAGRTGAGPASTTMTLVVQQLAALLKGGRTPARLWEELWLVHAGAPKGSGGRTELPGKVELSLASLTMLGAARSAAFLGSPVSDALRVSAPKAFPRMQGREVRIWIELAACLDIAEASGCPLADVLTRFAAQLEVEDDAEAARQTALAGPKATVSLLTWLPLMGLGLGVALGVDPLAILVGTPLGLAALACGAILTVVGRAWSSRLVQAAAGAALP